MTGTMGLSLPAFVGMWALMMTAMMLPSVAPVASMYQRSIRSFRVLRLGRVHRRLPAGLGRGWHPGVPAHRLRGPAGERPPGLGDRGGGGGVRRLRGVPAHAAEVPLSEALPLAAVAAAALRRLPRPAAGMWAGAHHGAYCLSRCWSLMALFVVVGVMNLTAMVVLAAVVLAEKLWVHGELLARAVGVAALALAVTVIWCRSWHRDSTAPPDDGHGRILTGSATSDRLLGRRRRARVPPGMASWPALMARLGRSGRRTAIRAELAEHGLQIRVGLHAGEVELVGDDIGGIAGAHRRPGPGPG